MLWYHVLGLYTTVVLGLSILLIVKARGLYRRNQSGNGRTEGRRPLLIKVWRWLRFIARCGRRRKRRAKPINDRREERRALRKQLREEAEEWLTEMIEKIVELGEDLLDTDFDDEDDEDDYYLNGDQGSSDDNSDERQVVYGLVNTGNSCFFNSVLQALASSEYLQNYLSNILERMDELNDLYDGNLISMPLTEALWETLTDLNAVVNRDSAFQPFTVMAALGSSILNDREQQDAQEAFQLISTALSHERQIFSDLQIPSLLNSDLANVLTNVDVQKPHVFAVPRGFESVGTKGLARVRALMKLAAISGIPSEGQFLTFGRRPILHNPFTGLMANRLSCAQCGYTEAVRHFAFDNVSLSLPLTASCTLDQALRDYISLEELSDVQCQKCILSQTLRRLISDIKCATSWLAENPSYNTEKYSDTECDSANICVRSETQNSRAQRRAERAEIIWRRAVLSHESKGEQINICDTNFDSDSDTDFSTDDDLEDSGRSDELGSEHQLYATKRRRTKESRYMPGTEYPLDPAKQIIDRNHNLPPPSLVNVPRIIKRLRDNADEVSKALRFDIQRPLPNITLHKAYSPLSTKQVAFAKLPPCLCLHLSRSAITPEGYIVKNPCHVRFPEYLDVSPYTTTGNLKVNPTESMVDDQMHNSSKINCEQPANNQHMSRRARDAIDALGYNADFQAVYRLQAVVVHIGSHSYGHYITYRRKPQPPSRSGINTPRYRSSSSVSLPQYNNTMPNMLPSDKRHALANSPAPIEQIDSLRRRRIVGGNASNKDYNDTSSTDGFLNYTQSTTSRPKRSWRVADSMTAEWYLISDEDVQAVTLPEVLNANPYLLIYERIDGPQIASYGGASSMLPSLNNLRNLARRSASAQSAPQTIASHTNGNVVDVSENGGSSSPILLSEEANLRDDRAMSQANPSLATIIG
ncbi:ubiquitin-specific protease ubp1 [Coemansia spiralis]|uniref:Ubiquitin carboxyl-terminal hydrolase n=2 Tax=Coemansia TaxID=4863 RepID=A0A9W8G9A6_9FUNG|nr:hypothetical protein BX070DRAFT_229249 [Coemansia spiralis]KAJ1994579.1 ubiquitin-specific protease ubp1 [Coemansia umbellata]KAJ2624385.1 ubiquitin-specific protease ubp1 [Coemansia sp. RSA 1358]KAJ2677553.1 ubiquitin-specific protease ubp1 [Coemansia spiralis]